MAYMKPFEKIISYIKENSVNGNVSMPEPLNAPMVNFEKGSVERDKLIYAIT